MKFDFIPDSVSHFDNAYDVLKERGFIEQSTNEDEIRRTKRSSSTSVLTRRQTACMSGISCRSLS